MISIAGTSLGDPIEVGAASAVLVDPRPSHMAPLVLMAAKSWTGHAEPGAGAVGLVHAQAALSQAAALPILHLGGLNPYVSGAPCLGLAARHACAGVAASVLVKACMATSALQHFAFC